MRFSRAAYLAYLRSEKWRRFRRFVIRQAGGVCEECGGTSDNGTVDVHHKTYERFGRERREDVKVLCRYCHSVADDERLWYSRVTGWAAKVYGPRWEMTHTWDEVESRFVNWLAQRGMS